MKKFDKKSTHTVLGPPLDEVKASFSESIDATPYPFCVPVIKNLTSISFPTQVTFLVGENGSGKSTILEAIASQAGFGPEGGSKNISFKTTHDASSPTELLAEQLTLSWRYKPKNGYFFRAESFFNVASFIDQLAGSSGADIYDSYGGKSLHKQSHGESFMSFFQNRLGKEGFFIFDEPEAALSPQRQLTLMVLMHEMCKNPQAQFIIATHSPILLAYPDATIYSCDADSLTRIEYTQTTHYQITKRFLDNPDRFLHHLFNDAE
jgi:predicted ATPase